MGANVARETMLALNTPYPLLLGEMTRQGSAVHIPMHGFPVFRPSNRMRDEAATRRPSCHMAWAGPRHNVYGMHISLLDQTVLPTSI